MFHFSSANHKYFNSHISPHKFARLVLALISYKFSVCCLLSTGKKKKEKSMIGKLIVFHTDHIVKWCLL